MTAVVDTSTPSAIGNASTLDIMTAPPMISRMTAATAIVDLHGDESGAASGREHGKAAKQNLIFWGLRSFRIYWPFQHHLAR